MKKTYISPALTVVRMNATCQMLAGSVDYDVNNVKLGGSADNTAAYGRESDFEDED